MADSMEQDRDAKALQIRTQRLGNDQPPQHINSGGGNCEMKTAETARLVGALPNDDASQWVKAIPDIIADEVFTMMGRFQASEEKDKVDLLIGAYRSSDGLPWPLPSVVEAETILQQSKDVTRHEYLPIEGDKEYLNLARNLLLDLTDSTKGVGRITSVQSISGSGAIHIGATFLSQFLKPRCVWVSDPTWGPHKLMFARAGVPFREYPYYDTETCLLDFDGMRNVLQAEARPGDVIMLQACAHNPTGLDLSQDQWKEIASICARKGLFPFFDVAYQGFATGDPVADAWPVRYFFDLQPELRFCAAQSFSKNFGLYGQRAGAFHFVSREEDIPWQPRIFRQLQNIIRTVYSVPPRTGSTIVKTILGNADLRAKWLRDVSAMSDRLKEVRITLYKGLSDSGEDGAFQHIVKQSGMFSYTGLSAAQVARLREDFHVYLLSSGRMSISGLNSKNMSQVTEAMKCVVREQQ